MQSNKMDFMVLICCLALTLLGGKEVKVYE